MIRLRILGSPDLVGHDGQVVLSVLSQPKRLTLLSYLALTSTGSFTPRDKLIGLFWPDSDPEHGRSSLRSALYGLRKSLGHDVVSARGDDEIGIAADVISCDALEFDAAVGGGDLRGAWALYGGPLLEHVSTLESAALDHWLEDQRIRYGRKAFEIALGLSAETEQLGDLPAALEWAREAQTLEPLSELGVRRVMSLLDRLDDREDALRVHDAFAARLAAELDLEPSAETTQLFLSIREGSRARSGTAEQDTIPAPALPSATPSPTSAITAPAATRRSPPEGPGPSTWMTRPRSLAVTAVALAAFVIAVVFWLPTSDPGVAVEQQRVVLADFSDATGDGIGDAVTEALRIDLLESSVLDLVDTPDIDHALALMRAEDGRALTADGAREVARREGIPGVIDGEVARAGSGYLITATLRAAESGRSLTAVRVTARGPDDVIASIDQLSEELREASGESLRNIRAGRPLEQVTTNSLEALQLYTEAASVMYRRRAGRPPGELLEAAVALDPEFAMAWRLLGVSRFQDPAGRAEAHTEAFRHRHRLRDIERYLVEGPYYGGVEVDAERAAQAYENVLRLDPDEPAALNNLANLYRGTFGDLKGAEELQRRAIAGPRRAILHYSTLVANLIHQGRLDDAEEVLRAWQGAFPNASPSEHFGLLFLSGDMTRAEWYARSVAEDLSQSPANRAGRLVDLARAAYWTGRLDEARALMLRAEVVAAQAPPVVEWQVHRDAAYLEALVGDRAWARRHLAEALDEAYARLPVAGGEHVASAMMFASSGDHEAAVRIVADWEAGKLPETRGVTDIARTELVSLHAAASRGVALPSDALPEELGCPEACGPFFRATLYDGVGDVERAIALYEVVLLPGYAGWGMNTGERLHAMMRLGPLYEESGDTAKAIAAYRRMIAQWAEGDARAQGVVDAFRLRVGEH